MNSERIKIGGTVRVMGGRADGFMHRIATWVQEDPDRARSELVGDTDPKTRQELLDQMIQNSGIMSDLTPILESIHNGICRLYVRHVSAYVLNKSELRSDVDIDMPEVKAGMSHVKWVNTRYTAAAHAIKFWISDCAKRGENYRESSWLIKNMRFTGWTPDGCPNEKKYGDLIDQNTEFKGFCKQEPVTRLLQLLTFPFELFGPLDMPIIDWVQPPVALIGDTIADHIDGARALTHEFNKWEKYYTRLAGQFQEFRSRIDAL